MLILQINHHCTYEAHNALKNNQKGYILVHMFNNRISQESLV